MSDLRLLVVGVDGLSHRILRYAIDEGMLPRFEELERTSAWAPMRCTWPPHTATGWPSLFTGTLPGEHGLFSFWDCQDPNYRLRVVRRTELGVPTLWDALASAGWSMGLLNIPMSHPPAGHPGYELTWPLEQTLHYTQPRSLVRELMQAGALALPDIACMYDGRPGYPDRALEYLGGRLRAVLHLLKARPVEAVAVVFTELDRVCHHYWHAIDPQHPRYGDATSEERQVVGQTLRAVDAALGALLDAAGDECTVLVVSDHGFGPGGRGVRLHHLLAEAGLCEPLPLSEEPENQVAPDWDLQTRATLAPLDWSRTTAYMAAPGSFGVNLNLRGRQSEGIVSRRDAPRVLDDVRACLETLEDPDRGGRLFAAVVDGRQAWRGPFAERAPDLLLVPSNPSVMVVCDLAGPTWTSAGQTGLHRLEGVWMLRGQAITEGPREEVAVESVASHLLQTLGLQPQGVGVHPIDGDARRAPTLAGLPSHAWSERCDPPVDLATAPVSRSAPTPAQAADPSDDDVTVSFDEAEIEHRLRQMGYL